MSYAKAIAKVIKDIDPKKIEEIRERFAGSNKKVNVGYPGGIQHKDEDGTTGDLTVAQIATIHEFGAPGAGIPERPFLRSGINRNRKKHMKLNRQNLVQVVRGKMNISQALSVLGEVAKGDVQDEIKHNGSFAPLKPETIARKGSSKPLIDSGQLWQSTTWELSDD